MVVYQETDMNPLQSSFKTASTQQQKRDDTIEIGCELIKR